MLRLVGLMLIVLGAMAFVGCKAGDDISTKTPSPSPTAASETPTLAPGEWATFAAKNDCIKFTYPADWKAQAPVGLTSSGAFCPGGTKAQSKVAPCNAATVDENLALVQVTAPGGSTPAPTPSTTPAGSDTPAPIPTPIPAPASIELYVAGTRCESMADHLNQVLMTETNGGRTAGPITNETVFGDPALCTDVTIPEDTGDYVTSLCTVEDGSNIYVLFRDSLAARRDEFKPTLDKIVAGWTLTQVPSPTVSPVGPLAPNPS
ncbi:MAG: hypothetical protein ABI559_02500 [Chloroflexota bacterium]